MPLSLTALFFVTAALYASVGFGGGSTYNALLVVNDTDYRLLPAIALSCNIVVVTGNSVRFWRNRNLPLVPLAPFLLASVPASLIGGRVPISQTFFVGILGIALLAAGVRLLSQSESSERYRKYSLNLPPAVQFGIGGAIGFVSGLVGIGGGIFLAPILYLMRWAPPIRIAAACSLFILVNSTAGLIGQMMKLNNTQLLGAAFTYWPLLLAVFAGGQLGAWSAHKLLRANLIKQLTAILMLYVSIRLLYRWGSLMGWYG